MNNPIIDEFLSNIGPPVILKSDEYDNSYKERLYPRQILAGQILQLITFSYFGYRSKYIITTNLNTNDTGAEVSYICLNAGRNLFEATLPVDMEGNLFEATFIPTYRDGQLTGKNESPFSAPGFLIHASTAVPDELFKIECADLFDRSKEPPTY
jgi:hypothetical protein